MKTYRSVLIGLLGLVVVGCTTDIPPRIQVRDVSSGRTYQTYQPWGEVTKGVGYEFTDLESGKHVTLTNYEITTLEGKKAVPNDSVDAKNFQAAKVRGGVN